MVTPLNILLLLAAVVVAKLQMVKPEALAVVVVDIKLDPSQYQFSPTQ
jgi:hypothetical protein